MARPATTARATHWIVGFTALVRLLEAGFVGAMGVATDDTGCLFPETT